MSVILLLLVLLAGCTGEPETATPLAEASRTPQSVPEVPEPTDPEQPGPTAEDDEEVADPTPAQDPEPPGDSILLHLDGPLDNREATDVVLRTDTGVEIDRFRLPGAVGVWSTPGSAYALIYTLPGSWARFDATTRRLTPIGFPGEVPAPTIRPGSGLAGPTAIWEPLDARWLLRMDSGIVTDLEPVAGASRVDDLSRDGTQAVLQTDDGPAVLTTATSALRGLAGVATAGLSVDASRLATLGPPGEAREVAVQQADGSDQQVLGTTPNATGVVPLDDGRVLLLGPAPGVMGADGIVAPLTPPQSIGRPVRLAADEAIALVSTGNGLAVVDLRALTTTPLADTAGFIPLEIGVGSPLWALSVDPQQPGALVVDTSTGVVTRFLDDRPTERFLSITTAGDRVSLALGGDGPSTVVVDADGTLTPVLADAARAEAWLHPDGEIVAASRIDRSDQALLLGRLGEDLQEIPTARNPVWLNTVSPIGRPLPGDGTPQGRPGN